MASLIHSTPLPIILVASLPEVYYTVTSKSQSSPPHFHHSFLYQFLENNFSHSRSKVVAVWHSLLFTIPTPYPFRYFLIFLNAKPNPGGLSVDANEFGLAPYTGIAV